MKGVVYFNMGTKCLVRLCVSLYSLRKVYDGPVAVMSCGSDGGICERIAKDLDANLLTIPVKQLRKNSAYCAKPSLWRHSPFETTLLIDSDTIVARDVRPMLDSISDSPQVLVTHFSDWVTTGKMISGRILKWRGVKCDGLNVESMIDRSLDRPHAAINTGVVGWSTRSKAFLKDWEQLTNAGAHCPFTDELAAQLLVRDHDHLLCDDRYNCSPLFGRNKDLAVIWHFHGKKHLRDVALPIWLPVYQECLAKNVAGIKDWTPAGDPALINYLEQNPC